MNEPVAKRRPMIDLDEFERRLRQPAPPRKEDEPLVELAKLGDQENDPFKTVFEARPQEPERHPAEIQSDNLTNRRQDALWEEQLGRTFGDDFSAIEAGLRNNSWNEASPRTQRTHYGEFVDHTIGAESWPGDGEEEDYAADLPTEKRSRKPLYIMAGIIVLGLTGIGGTFVLKSMHSGQHEVALIKADSSPSKIQPQVSRDSDIAPQDDSILQKNSSQPGAAGITDNSEQPVDLSQAQTQEKLPRVIPLNQNNQGAGGAASVPVPAPPQASEVQPQFDNPPQSIAALIEPKKVKTISVRPDGTIITNDTPPPVPPSIAPIPVPRPSSVGLNARAATPKTTPRAGTTPKSDENVDQIARLTQALPEAAPRRNPPAAETANAGEPAQALPDDSHAAGGNGGFTVQLAAPPTEQEARAVQIKLLKEYAGVFSGQHSTIRRAGTAEKPIYRVRVGTNLTREEATEICQKVQSKGGSCFVAKNER